MERLWANQATSVRLENRYVRRDGSILWGSTGIGVHGGAGEDPHCIVQVQDVSERVEVEQRLRQSEQRFRDVAYSAGEYIWEMDTTGRYTLITERVQGILGVPADQLVGRSPFEFMLDDESQVMRDWYRCIVDTGRPFYGVEYRGLDASGKTVWQRIGGTPIRDTSGEVIGYRGTGLDITKLKLVEQDRIHVAKQLREALAQAQSINDFKSRFLANMSHEIRTPMTAILGFANILVGLPDAKGVVVDYVRVIRSNADQLLALLNDILDLSKIEAGQLTVQIRPCHPVSIVEHVISTMRVKAEEKMLELRVECDREAIPAVRSDSVRLTQIVSNLVSNAIKFTDDGSVTIKIGVEPGASPPGEVLCFSVADTGIGIEPDVMKGIFDPFAQAVVGERRAEGTGLGLDISRLLAGLLGAELSVESEVGRGSVFKLMLPLTEETRCDEEVSDPTSGDHEALAGADLNGHRVLVVDDSHHNQQIVRLLLEQRGVQVETADDGEAGVEAVLAARDRGGPFDLIIMDVQMPRMDGHTAARRLRESGITTPIVAFTAHAMVGDAERCLEAGCDAYVSKPIVPQAFFGTIVEQLRRGKAATAADPGSAGAGGVDSIQSLAQDPRFQKMRREYIESLAETASSLDQARADRDSDRLHVIVHRLAGTAASYGLPRIGEAARA
jgi:PAS domain S-box-containing protein